MTVLLSSIRARFVSCSFLRYPLMSSSQIAEFDTPLKLIRKEDGIFRNMCLKSGTYTELEAEAKAKAERDLIQA
jgi:hypothetical protein